VDLRLLDSSSAFRKAFLAVAPAERDGWVDSLLGIPQLVDDGPHLPRGCVPYLPCSVDALWRVIQHAAVEDHDVFVDIGSGVGRAALLTHLLTGATTIGLEIQPELVAAQRELYARVGVSRCTVLAGDAAHLCARLATGSVFFLYCPFSGQRLEAVLDVLMGIARTRPIRICCLDLELGARPWLERMALPFDDLSIYRSTLHAVHGAAG
jgi:SAM-dependent methyltransferase